MNRAVVIEKGSAAKDAIGQPVIAWTTVRSGYASITPLTGSATPQAGAEVSSVSVQIDMRFRIDVAVTAGMRVRYQNQIFAIKAAFDVEMKHETLRLICTEGENQG